MKALPILKVELVLKPQHIALKVCNSTQYMIIQGLFKVHEAQFARKIPS